MFRPHRRRRREGKQSQPGLIPLCDMLTGEHGRVVEIHGGGGLHSRMAALGFTPGVEVIILQNCRPGSLIACVREARVALGHGEASQILVEWKGRDGGDAPCE